MEEREIVSELQRREKGMQTLTEVFEGLLNLLDGQVDVDIGGNEWSVEPVVVVIAVYSVCSQLIVGELLLQQTDDFHLWKISAVTHICHKTKEREKNPIRFFYGLR